MPVDPESHDEMETLNRLHELGRSFTDEDRALFDPPADLWSSIAAAASATETDTLVEAPPAPPEQAGGVVHDLARQREVSATRRRPTTNVMLAVAAAMVLVAGAVGVLVSQSGDGVEVVASTELELLAGGGEGTAELVEQDDGLHLVVDVSGMTAEGEADYFEVWMLAADVSDMRSMATFDASTERLDIPVPEGVDPADFPLVDISEELDDGDSTHSGHSVLRGSLA